MAYDSGYGKRQRSDGNSYGMPPKRMAGSSHEYGSMSGGRQGGYHGDYGGQQQKMSRPGHGHEEKPTNILLFTIYNPKYPITVDVMHTITSPHGTVNRIVIFRKNGVQAMVEFETVDEAERAKDALHGADIYSGCCTLKVDWGKPTRLNVVKNDSDSWDYTNPNLGKEIVKNQPLLPDPKFEPPMYGGGGGHMDGPPGPGPGPRRGPPPPEYGYEGPGFHPQAEPYEPYGPPQPRFSAPRQQQGPYNEMYGRGPSGPPRPPMRGGGAGGGMSGPRPPAMPSAEFDDASQGGPGMLQQGSVLMVYGLNAEKMNCQKLFNVFCLYGNVVRIKFLKSKDGVAMVQLGDNASCNRAIENLNGSFIFGSKLVLGISKQAFIQDVPNPIDLPDGSASFIDFMGSRNNRFTTPEAASKNRIQPANKVLYFFNAPPNLSEDTICELFTDLGLKAPVKIKVFPARSERSSTGLLEWENKGDAIEALVTGNHQQLPSPTGGKNPYVLKLCFSGTLIKG